MKIKSTLIIYFIILLCCLPISSCNKDISDINIDKEEQFAKVIEGRYIVFDNNNYMLNLSRYQASNLGLTDEFYEEVRIAIEMQNKMLDNIISEVNRTKSDNKHIVVMDCTYDEGECEYKAPLLITRDEAGSSGHGGTISTNGQETGSSPMFIIPSEYRSIYANCYANIAWGAGHAVTVSNFGNTIIGTRVGNGDVTVNLLASNTSCTVKYSTTDSNGGRCAWSARK